MKRIIILAALAVASTLAAAQQGPTKEQFEARLGMNYFKEILRADREVTEKCGQFSGIAGASFKLLKQGKTKREVAMVAIQVGERYGIEMVVALLAIDIAESAMMSKRAAEIHEHEVTRMAFGFCIGAEANERGHSRPGKNVLPYSGKGVQS